MKERIIRVVQCRVMRVSYNTPGNLNEVVHCDYFHSLLVSSLAVEKFKLSIPSVFFKCSSKLWTAIFEAVGYVQTCTNPT